METVVIVAIGVLATIFLASFAALVVVCRQRYCRPRDLLQRYDSKPIVDLIGAMETQSEPSELELDDVVITNPHIEAILENEDWIEDASGLMSHCIAILKSGRCGEIDVPSVGPQTPGCADYCPAPVCQSSGAGDQECLPPDRGPGLDRPVTVCCGGTPGSPSRSSLGF
uniref:Transmembrane protein 98 n=1 Tax=Felis catus TaxID=9685 RepID=A0ABI7YCI2_FELCA